MSERTNLESMLLDNDKVDKKISIVLFGRTNKRLEQRENIVYSCSVELSSKIGRIEHQYENQIISGFYSFFTSYLEENLSKNFKDYKKYFDDERKYYDNRRILKFETEIKSDYEKNLLTILFPNKEEAKTLYEKRAIFFMRFITEKTLNFPEEYKEYIKFMKSLEYIKGTYRPTIRIEGKSKLLGFSRIILVPDKIFKKEIKLFYRSPK